MTERVVRAYAGGPDTSVCVGRLAGEAGAEELDAGDGFADALLRLRPRGRLRHR
ncbi:hypothetical protein ACFVFQ_20555 [Streptomyces sp. NPDC057743]|uniref:hypothetical protein n=1 Tax=Streptomyces sp. NPDC057743 TaxID=3346236 RepID=UPI0036A3313C